MDHQKAVLTLQTLQNEVDQERNTGSKSSHYSILYILGLYKPKLVTGLFLFRRKFKRSLTMTSLPLAFFKGCTSGNQDPNSPDSPIMTNGNGNVIGKYHKLVLLPSIVLVWHPVRAN